VPWSLFAECGKCANHKIALLGRSSITAEAGASFVCREREREREKERKKERKTERERKKERKKERKTEREREHASFVERETCGRLG
jgi:hypothetical protein